MVSSNYDEQARAQPHIILVPYPAQGHVSPIIRLALVLCDRGFRPTVALPDFIHRRITARTDFNDGRVGFASVPSGLCVENDRDFFAIERSMEEKMPAHLERLLLGSGGGGVACVVVDLLASWAIEVAERCGVRVTGFWPAMHATYRLISAIPELIETGIISDSGIPFRRSLFYLHHRHRHHRRHPNGLKLSTGDLPWLVGDPNSQKSRFRFWLRTLKRSANLPILLINSFPRETGELEAHDPNHRTRVLSIGPVLFNRSPLPSPRPEDEACLSWLDSHPPGSVIYVSFGTWVGPFGPEETAELALGLEAARRPFLWAMRSNSGLPEGFAERVAERGKIVPWAPQEAVLAHAAVGCFLTHCGWNSTVEAVTRGRTMLCWPVAGDQFVNREVIVRRWGVGVRLREMERGCVADGVERAMEIGGERAVVEMKERVAGAEGVAGATAALQCFIDAAKYWSGK